MTVYEIMTVVTFVTSTLTMVVLFVAVLPHMKNGIAIVRDAVLWIAMIVLLCIALIIGWKQLIGPSQDASDVSSEDDHTAFDT